MSNWISAHLFYYAKANPLLVECVAPLVKELREKQLITRYFFIRYWENGTHIRLRLTPASAEAEPAIKALVEARCEEFFRRRPAPYEIDTQVSGPMYRKMFEMEYGAEAYLEKYGDAFMPFYPSNSVKYLPYQPEHSRYAGPRGMEFSERHFEVSSDLTLQMIADYNTHVRSVLLGHGFQAMLCLVYGVWQTDAKVRKFFDLYLEMWSNFQTKGQLKPNRLVERYDKLYRNLRERLHGRFYRVRELQDGIAEPTPMEESWLRHGQELRRGIEALVEAGELELPEDLPGLDGALLHLMRSYIHMTNNRLGLSIQDEVYLCHLGVRALEALDVTSDAGSGDAEHAA